MLMAALCETLDEDMLFNGVERFANLPEIWAHILRDCEECKESKETSIDLDSIKA